MRLDLLDSKILHELGLNSRQTNSQMGKKIGTSQQVVSYRIKQLLKRKIITEFFTVIHFGAFGFSNYVAMIKLKDITKDEKKKLIDNLYKNGNILLISECGGRWDLIVNIISNSPANFDKEYSKILGKNSNLILNYDLFLSLGGASFGRKYIYAQKEQRRITPFGKEEMIKPSHQELEILKSISKNARNSAVEIESKIGINYKTIIQKIKQLQEKGIITGFRPFIDVTKISYYPIKIYLDLNKMAEEEEQKFTSFLSSNKNIIGTLKMIGKWNFSITIETNKQEDVWKIYKEIQDYLGSKIKSIELIPIFKKHEYRYFPEILLKDYLGGGKKIISK
jgi:DNA-binding Lrp family transcriptional regulator